MNVFTVRYVEHHHHHLIRKTHTQKSLQENVAEITGSTMQKTTPVCVLVTKPYSFYRAMLHVISR